MSCTRKCSLFCLFMSSWGFLMLIVLGACFSVKSLVLIHDLPLGHSFSGPEDFKGNADVAYSVVALRCFVTAIVYLVFVVISAIVFHKDNKRRKRLYKKRKQTGLNPIR